MATPNMNLTLPIPNVTSGTWGNILNAAIEAVDAHDHSTNNGVDVLAPRRMQIHNAADYGSGYFPGGGTFNMDGPRNSVTPGVSGDFQTMRFRGNDDSGQRIAFAGVEGELTDPTAGAPRGLVRLKVAGPGGDIDSGTERSLVFKGDDCSLRTYDAGVERANLSAYDLFFSSMGLPDPNQVLARIVAVRAFTVPVNGAGSRCSVGVNPTAAAVLLLQVNGVTAVTVDIAINGAATFTNAAPVAVVAGDVITLVAQNIPDVSMADIALTIVGAL